MANLDAGPADSPGRPHEGDQDLRSQVARAVDFRGDVTLHLATEPAVEGYVYDGNLDAPSPCVRILLKEGGRRTIRLDQVQRIEFTGQDMAHGKSWEAWVKRYNEKKQADENSSADADGTPSS